MFRTPKESILNELYILQVKLSLVSFNTLEIRRVKKAGLNKVNSKLQLFTGEVVVSRQIKKGQIYIRRQRHLTVKKKNTHKTKQLKQVFLFQVTDSHRLWGWLRQEFLPNIYSQPWYNGRKDKKDVYIGNKMSILIGMPWMRQLRIKKSRISSVLCCFL